MKSEIGVLTRGGCFVPSNHHVPESPLRVLLYSHDSWGLGHLRRSLAIAGEIASQNTLANMLVVTGSPVATQFDLPERCDVLKLPAVSKGHDGRYISRHLSSGINQTIELRRRLIQESCRSFDPHLIIIDHQLTGLHDEALGMLREAREQNKLLIYGMRDVLDAPEKVAPAWDTPEHRWALQHAYDRICVYGTPEVFDPSAQYAALARLRHKIEFTGYVVSSQNRSARQAIPSFRKKVLVTMGGGEDGQQRIEAYIESLLIQPARWDSHIVTGPLMKQSLVRQFKRRVYQHGLAGQVRVSRFHPSVPRLLQESDAVVSMAGYNSCAEIMQSGIPAVLMPRRFPRKEQLIRARRLEDMGLASCLVSEDPLLLRNAVEQALEKPSFDAQAPRLDGLERFCSIIRSLMDSLSNPSRPASAGHLKIASE